MRSLPFLLGEALVNLKRHGLMTAAAITTITVSLALLGGFVIFFYQVNTAAQRVLDNFEMRVFCRPEIKKEDVARVGRRIGQLPGVAAVTYLSRERVWAEQTRDYPIETAGIPNLMNDTFVVKVADPRAAPAVAREVRGWRKEVQDVSLPEEDMGAAVRLAGVVRDAGIGGAAVLLLGALVVVSNAIRISVFARRREIRIMQLVGAAPWFIRLPLLVEGLLHGLAGGALACACLLAAGRYVGGLIRDSVPMLVPYGGAIDLPRCGLALIALGALIGASGSLVSIRRYL